MSAETPAAPGHDEHHLRVIRRNFRAWRGTRPFWAGLFVMLGGLPIAYFPYANLQIGHLTQALHEQPGAREQEHRQRGLRDEQRLAGSGMAGVAARTGRSGLERCVEVRP